MKAVILAGGIGSRMGEICREIPKPMVKICGKPILLNQIEALKKEGITDFIIVTCYLSEKIEEYFGDGSKFGVSISYYREESPLGTAGALFHLGLKEDFLLINGDLIFDIDLKSMLSFHNEKNSLATLLVHPNNHPYDSTVIDTDGNDRVAGVYFKNEKPEYYPNLCNAGIQIVSPGILDRYEFKGKADFDKDIVAASVDTGRIFAYRSAEYVHDVGTLTRLENAEKDILSLRVENSNKRKLHKAVFLDRDGTVNIYKGYITKPCKIELSDGVEAAISRFHALGYLVIIVTNQPVIARGDCTKEELEQIHRRLEMLLGEKGAYIDRIYYCPHHPDKGFEGEVSQLKLECSCRKPEPGLLLKAQKDYNIDLSQSYMVGDSISDVEAGKKAGCTPVFLGEDKSVCELVFSSVKEFSDYLK